MFSKMSNTMFSKVLNYFHTEGKHLGGKSDRRKKATSRVAAMYAAFLLPTPTRLALGF